jgi:hypothetical protein
MASIGGKTGLGVSTVDSAFPLLLVLDADLPAKLCSNGLGSMSNFEHPCKNRMGLVPLIGAGFSDFSSSADVAMIYGTELEGEGGKSIAE